MTNNTNVGSGGPNPRPDLTAYIPPPATGAPADLPPLPPAGGAGQNNATYFQDTQSISNLQASLVNLLNNIPPPNSQLAGVAGAAGDGNPFLAPNALVAFFITFNEISTILRQTSNAQQRLIELEMAIITDLAEGEAAQILAAAKAESDMYIASAVASFAEAGSSLVQLAASLKGEKSATKEMDNKKIKLQDELDVNTGKAEKAQADLDIQTARAKEATDNLNSINNKIANNEVVPQNELDAARTEFYQAQEDLHQAKSKSYDAQRDLQNTQDELKRYDKNYAEDHQRLVQANTFRVQMTGQFLTKSIDGIANMIKAVEALNKGQAEATQKLLASYQQNAFKMLDQLNNARAENSKMIADLMQQLRKFSDDAKKLGGSIAVQAGV